MAHPRIALVPLLALLAACILPATAESKTDAASVIAKFKAKDPDSRRSSTRRTATPSIRPSARGPSGSAARTGRRGLRARRPDRTSSLSQLTIGFQFGGQAYSEVIFFKDKTALDDFKRGNFELNAQASAIALTERASRDLAYNRGVAIVTMGKGASCTRLPSEARSFPSSH